MCALLWSLDEVQEPAPQHLNLILTPRDFFPFNCKKKTEHVKHWIKYFCWKLKLPTNKLLLIKEKSASHDTLSHIMVGLSLLLEAKSTRFPNVRMPVMRTNLIFSR